MDQKFEDHTQALITQHGIIKPILRYGSEVWGPYTGFDYTTWAYTTLWIRSLGTIHRL